MEFIKFKNKNYELVSGGYQLDSSNKITVFKPAESSFSTIESELADMKSIVLSDSNFEPLLTRSDVIYAGRLMKDDNYIIGVDPETGDNIFGTVYIASFREPDVAEQYKALEAKVAYIAMMSGLDLEV